MPESTRSESLQPARWEWLLLAASGAVPVSLLWDYSWESTVGIDLVWGGPHILTYIGVALA